MRMTIAFGWEDGAEFSVHVQLYTDMKKMVIYKGVLRHAEERK